MKNKAGISLLGAGIVWCALQGGCKAFGEDGSLLDGIYGKEDAAQITEIRQLPWEVETEKAETEKTGTEEAGLYAEAVSVPYVYGTLDEETQAVYDEIYRAVVDYEEKVKVSTLDTELLDRAYRALTADHGEIFWVSGYVYTRYTLGNKLVGIDFSPNYTMDCEKRDEVRGEIEASASDILSKAPSGEASDYEKAKFVFEYLAENVDYDINAGNNQNIISVFLYGKTVCQGYANATQYLLGRLGIQSAIVSGLANGEPHAWNLARLDGAYYYIDTTWGNSAYAGDTAGEKRFVNYNYFGATTEEIRKTHTAEEAFLLPECTEIADNYYVKEGRYFTEWDPDAVGEVCRTAYDAGEETVSVKFSSGALYERMKQYLIDEGHISDYCRGIFSLYYVEDADLNVLTLSFS